MSESKGKLFSEPVGPSEIPGGAFGWNNKSSGTPRDVTCELCGTEHEGDPTRETSRTIGTFLGLQYVEDCCGAAIDQLYREFGGRFTEQFLKEFGANPTDPRFAVFLICLGEALANAAARLKETQTTVGNCQSSWVAIQSATDKTN